MLVVSRRLGEEIVIQTPVGNVVVCVTEIRGGKVRLGVTAPKVIPVDRREVYESKYESKRESN